jgi:glucose-6-phosphate 1-dehydrogenase
MTKVPGLDRGGVRLREVPLDIRMADAFAGPTKRIAYERLLLDLIEGDQTLFVRRDEVEAQWTWIDGVRACWTDNDIAPALSRGQLGADRRHRAGRQGWRGLARMNGTRTMAELHPISPA